MIHLVAWVVCPISCRCSVRESKSESFALFIAYRWLLACEIELCIFAFISVCSKALTFNSAGNLWTVHNAGMLGWYTSWGIPAKECNLAWICHLVDMVNFVLPKDCVSTDIVSASLRLALSPMEENSVKKLWKFNVRRPCTSHRSDLWRNGSVICIHPKHSCFSAFNLTFNNNVRRILAVGNTPLRPCRNRVFNYAGNRSFTYCLFIKITFACKRICFSHYRCCCCLLLSSLRCSRLGLLALVFNNKCSCNCNCND